MAATTTAYPALQQRTAHLLIHAATDRPVMEPLLRDFQAVHRGVAIDYVEMQSGEVHDSVAAAPRPPDLAISSALDLQAKLVNDGWTQPHVSAETALVPSWANWRDEAYGFTLEPATIVYATQRLATGEVPRCAGRNCAPSTIPTASIAGSRPTTSPAPAWVTCSPPRIRS